MGKEYIVSLNVSFTTPIGVTETTEGKAEIKAKSKFLKLWKEFEKKLDDVANLDVDIDYVEES